MTTIRRVTLWLHRVRPLAALLPLALLLAACSSGGGSSGGGY